MIGVWIRRSAPGGPVPPAASLPAANVHFIFEVFEGAGRGLFEDLGPPGREIRTWT